MLLSKTEVRIQGKDTYLPSVQIDDCTVVSRGALLRTGELFDEELVRRVNLPDPERFLPRIKRSPLGLDLFSFAQRPPDLTPRYPYSFEWDNWAVAATTSFDSWWNGLPQESRKNARQAEKKGITVRSVAFDDILVHGIKRIYDETPVRQGRAFWHYGKTFEAVKKENATYLDRSTFIGAYFNDQLIGFIKFIEVDEFAVLIQILAMAEHRDKKPMNALLSHTMQVCGHMRFGGLVYGKYHYGTTNDSSLTEFKRRNGFVEVRFPRYTIAFTLRGKFVLKFGLQKGWKNMIPLPIRSRILSARSRLVRTQLKA